MCTLARARILVVSCPKISIDCLDLIEETHKKVAMSIFKEEGGLVKQFLVPPVYTFSTSESSESHGSASSSQGGGSTLNADLLQSALY